MSSDGGTGCSDWIWEVKFLIGNFFEVFVHASRGVTSSAEFAITWWQPHRHCLLGLCLLMGVNRQSRVLLRYELQYQVCHDC